MSTRLLRSSVVLLLAAAVPSQDPAATVAGVANGTAPLAVRGDGVDVCGVGPNFLLRATRDGVTFTPMLGASAPRSLPLTLRLAGVARGDVALPVGAAVRTTSGAAVSFDRGDLRERYELRADGVEQTFVFASRPAGVGDLVVRLAIAGPAAGTADDDGGVRFVDEHGRGVVYGALLGIDARGATAPGTLQLVGGELRLRLPATFVDAAYYPLTLDPLLGTAALANSTADDGDPAVAWVSSPARWLVVWRRVVAIGESHLIGQLTDPITGGGPAFVISAAAGIDVSLPRVGGCQSALSFAVAWRSVTGPFGQQPSLNVRAVPANGASGGSVQQIATDPHSLALANAAPNNTTMPMVWVDAAGLVRSLGLQFTGSVALTTTGGGTLDGAAAPTANVAITHNSSSPVHYAVAWSRSSSSPTELACRIVDASGVAQGPPTSVTGSVLPDHPSLDGDGATFLVTWLDVAGVHARPCAIVPSGALFVANTTGPIQGMEFGSTLHNGDVAKVGPRYLVSYRVDASLFDTSSRAQVTDANGVPIGPASVLAGPPRLGSYERQGTARLSAPDPFDGSDDRLLAVFEEGQTVLPLDRDVVLQQLEAMGVGGPVTQLAPGCGGIAVCAVNGPSAVGNDGFAIRLVNGDATAVFALLSLAVQPVLVPCGPCSLLVPDVLETLPIVNGSALRPFPLPLDNNLIGASFVAEWLPAFGTTGPCSLFPFVTTSTVTRIELGF